jgi:hypothetical protein
MPGVFCGLVIDPTDAFLFGQINDGNAIAMPYAKGFGWAAELNLQDCYRKLFEGERGLGYPKERAEIMRKNRGILKDLKAATCHDMLSALKAVDQDLLKAAVAGERFQDLLLRQRHRRGHPRLYQGPDRQPRPRDGLILRSAAAPRIPARSGSAAHPAD